MLFNQKEFREQVEADFSISNISSNKKLEKCTSATQISNLRRNREEKSLRIIEPSRLPVQSSQFAFCLKIKMISLIHALGTEQSDLQKMKAEDPIEVLSFLSSKIKNYQKETSKRLHQAKLLIKSLEIAQINYKTQVKSNETQLHTLKSKIEKLNKSHLIDLSKLNKSLQQKQCFIDALAKQLQQALALNNEQQKIIIQLQNKLLYNHQKLNQLEAHSHTKEKQLLQRINEQIQKSKKYEQQIENHKESVMKLIREANAARDQCAKHKEIIEGKDNKIQRARREYNILLTQYEKAETEFKLAEQRWESLIEQMKIKVQLGERRLNEQNCELWELSHKIQGRASEISEMREQFATLQQCCLEQKNNKTKIVEAIEKEINELLKRVEQSYERRVEMIQKQNAIIIEEMKKSAEIQSQKKITDSLDRYIDQIFALKKKLSWFQENQERYCRARLVETQRNHKEEKQYLQV